MTPDGPAREQQLPTWLPRLRRYARALAGNREDADDLVQDTLLRAWSRPGLWGGVADVRAWLFAENQRADAVNALHQPPPLIELLASQA